MMSCKQEINICFAGCVSTGKSKIINALYCKELTPCKIRRTTMVPSIYKEFPVLVNTLEMYELPILPIVSNSDVEMMSIYERNRIVNEQLLQSSEEGVVNPSDYTERVYYTKQMIMSQTFDNVSFNVYDIPGLNDAKTKEIYYDYLSTHFHQFDIICFVIDLMSSMNTSDENDILNFIVQHTEQKKAQHKNIYTIVIVNKADELQMENDTLVLQGEPLEMFEQACRIIRKQFESHGLQEHLLSIIPICALDAYLYRMTLQYGDEYVSQLDDNDVIKIGVNLCGKSFNRLPPTKQRDEVIKHLQDTDTVQTMLSLTGFATFEQIIATFLTDEKLLQLRVEKLHYQLSLLPPICSLISPSCDIQLLIQNYIELLTQICDTAKTIEPLLQYRDRLSNIIVKEIININVSTSDIQGVLKIQIYVNTIIIPVYYKWFSPEEYGTDSNIANILNVKMTEFIKQATSHSHDSSSTNDEEIMFVLEFITNCHNNQIQLNVNLIMNHLTNRMTCFGICPKYWYNARSNWDRKKFMSLLSHVTLLCDQKNIIRFIRAFIICHFYDEICENMIQLQMFYFHYREEIMYNVITNSMHMIGARYEIIRDNVDKYVNGCDFNDELFVLDNFYIQLLQQQS